MHYLPLAQTPPLWLKWQRAFNFVVKCGDMDILLHNVDIVRH